MNTRDAVAAMESRIDAFEAAKCLDPSARITDFLPPSSHPSYREVLLELLRVDLELSWNRGESKTVDDYRNAFADELSSSECLSSIAFEEYRLRWQNGEQIDAETFARRFGVDASDWPVLVDSTTAADQPFMQSSAVTATMPQPGDSFGTFEILEELGRGAVGRVFLAKQKDLAERPVVLKCSTSFWHESDRIARLQHTNIVPIHSVHRIGSVQAICMPYFGRTTLEQAIKDRSDWRQYLPSRTLPKSDLDQPDTNGTDGQLVGSHRRTPMAQGTSTDREISCLRIIGKLAEGLAHAHERGIWHQDIKPANVLLADHGQPMLLDFNLAREATEGDVLAAGGTLAYMSPEQLRGLNGRSNIGPWSDVYSLGVVLFEMLTGAPPFPSKPAREKHDSSAGLTQREAPPSVREVNPHIGPSTSAIIQRCLEYDVDRRYQSADELVEDIQCHLHNQPLRHAANVSFRERVGKWICRHPRITSASSVGALAAACLAVVAMFAVWQSNQVAQFEALSRLQNLQTAVERCRAPLTVSGTSAELIADAAADLQDSLATIAPKPDEWRDSETFSALNETGRAQLGTGLGDAFYLLANASAASVEKTSEETETALRFNRLSEDAFSMTNVPLAVYLQRAALGDGSIDQARKSNEVDTETASPRDLALYAGEHLRSGNYSQAIQLLQRAKEKAPKDYNIRLLLGNCQFAQGRLTEATLEYTAASSLWPESHIPYMFRGLARLESGELEDAVRDFSRVLRIRPQLNAALINRAHARIKQQRLQDALTDLNQVIDSGTAPTRTYFLRSKVRKRLGDTIGAQQDRDKGFQLPPVDEVGHIARAVARLPDDPQRCKKELADVLRANPNSTRALQNMAHVCSEYLDEFEEAIGFLNRILRIRPDDFTAIIGRGVLLARSGRLADSLDDVEPAIAKKEPISDTNAYQLACLYAWNFPTDASCREKTLKYLATAMRQNPRWVTVAPKDRDLENIHGLPEFERLVAAAKLLHRAEEPPRVE